MRAIGRKLRPNGAFRPSEREAAHLYFEENGVILCAEVMRKV